MVLRFSQIGGGEVNVLENIFQLSSFVIVVQLVFLATGMYQLETCRDLRITLIRMITGLFMAFIAMSVLLFSFPDIGLWRSVTFYAFSISIIGLLISRYLFLQIADLNQLKKRVLVLGAGERAARVRASSKNEASYVKYKNFLRMADNETDIEDAVEFSSIGDLAKYVRDFQIQEIVVAIQERRGSLPVDSLLDCKMNGCQVTDAATFIEQQSGAVNLASVNPSWLIFSDGFGRGNMFDQAMKKTFDVTASLLVLSLTLPVLILAALMVKITSPGPIFYRQERVGLNGKTFEVMKFRSMTVNAEADGVPKWAQENDVRVTTFGKFIRATRIDEIPQIFNVLRGDMSFVGPRPERPFFVEQLGEKMAYYHERHRVKPGITGWAQLNYPYGASEEDSKRKLEYDLYYIKNYSIFLDLLILIQTVRVVLWPEGVR